MNLDECKKMLRQDEGTRPFPYDDATGKRILCGPDGGNITIGVGRNLSARTLSSDEIDLLLTNDIRAAQRDVNQISWPFILDAPRYWTFVMLCFNMGIGSPTRGLLSFKNGLAAAKAGQWDLCAQHFLNSKWARDVGPKRAKKLCLILQTGIWPK